MCGIFTSASPVQFKDSPECVRVLLSRFDGTSFVFDKNQLLNDIFEQEKIHGISQIGGVFIHNAQSQAVSDFCLSVAVFSQNDKNHLEMFVAWPENNEHYLDKISRLVNLLVRFGNSKWKTEELFEKISKLFA